MNNTEARFMRLRRFSEEEVAALHAEERGADLAWRARRDAPGDRGPGWYVAGAQKLTALEVGKPPFWSARTPSDERDRAVEAFVKAPPVRRACAMIEDQAKTDVEAQHGADWVAWKLAPMVGTGVADELRARTAGV